MARIYNFTPIADITTKCTAIEVASECYAVPTIYLGDVRGFLYVYRYGKNKETLIQAQTEVRIAKSKIDRLKADRVINTLFALAEGVLIALDLESLTVLQKWDKSVAIFTLNEHLEYSGNIAFASKRKIQKYQMAPAGARERFVLMPEDLVLPDTPVAMSWYEESLCLGFNRRPYIIVHSGNGSTIKEIGNIASAAFTPYVRVIEDMFYCCWGGGLLVPIYSRNGENANKSPMNFQEMKRFIGVSFQGQFLITVSEGAMEVFNYSDHVFMQREIVPPDNPIVAMADFSSPLIVATTRGISRMLPIPYRDQIRNLLQECKIPEAQMILESNITLDEEGALQRENFNLDAAWCLFKKLQFAKSADYFMLTNFDPRDLMSLFTEFASSAIYTSSSGARVQTAASLVSEVLGEADKKVNPQALNTLVAETTLQCKLTVLVLLKERRNAIFKPPKSGSATESINFLHSEYSFNKVIHVPLTRQETLELLDLFLFKMYVEMGLSEPSATKLKEKFGKTYTLLVEEMLDASYKPYFSLENCIEFLSRFRELTPMIQAMVYEYFDSKDQALNIWRELGLNRDPQIREMAGRQTAKILMKCTDRNYVLQNVRWVLHSFPQIGLEVFTSPKESHHISYDNVLDVLQNENTSENCLIEKYLRWLIEEKQVEAERFHTRLALSYIDALFLIHPATEKGDAPVGHQGKVFQDYKNKLLKFLDTSKHYRTSLVLERIEGSWLVEARVLLLCRERNFDEALRIKVRIAADLNNFEEVENFCLSKGEGLLTKLLELYITKVGDATKAWESCTDLSRKGNLKHEIDKYQSLSYGLMQRYADNSELDPMQVIEILPSSWPLNTATQSLYSYLYVALSHTLHQVRTTLIMKSVCEMDLLNVECEASKYKSASVRISQERLCPVCHKKIGDRPFAVYPNGKTVHQQCSAHPSICPVTNTNFETQL